MKKRWLIYVIMISFPLFGLSAGEKRTVRYWTEHEGQDLVYCFDQAMPKIGWLDEIEFADEMAKAAGGHYFLEFRHNNGSTRIVAVRVTKGGKPIDPDKVMRVLSRRLHIKLEQIAPPGAASFQREVRLAPFLSIEQPPPEGRRLIFKYQS